MAFLQYRFAQSSIVSTIVQADWRGPQLQSSRDSLTYNHQRELKSFLHRLAMNLIWQVGESNVSWGLWVGELPLLCVWREGDKSGTSWLQIWMQRKNVSPHKQAARLLQKDADFFGFYLRILSTNFAKVHHKALPLKVKQIKLDSPLKKKILYECF